MHKFTSSRRRKNNVCYIIREAAKKGYFLNGSAIKRGEGVKGLPLRKIIYKNIFGGIFFFNWSKKSRQPLRSRGGGGKALMALPLGEK